MLLAQSSSPTSFPLPSAVPSGTTVKVDGSSSMIAINEALKSRFIEQFAGTEVNLAATGTDSALRALVNGNIDLAAIGRPLTAEEKAQGLVEAPISREKVAIIVNPENPFDGDITFERFAQVFRGEIKNWSELGGSSGAIRLVDRPDSSDTRVSLSQYRVFAGAPFETGANATQVSQDDTAAVIAELGNDGIGYAIASQVLNQPSVKIISMHQTLPDDPRYPFSQPRNYVYKGTPNPAVQAFLGFSGSPAGQEAIAAARTVEATSIAAASASPVASPEASVVPSPTEVSPTVSPTTALAPDAPVDRGGFPGWLGWLLLPLIGGGLWWLARGRRSGAESVAEPPPVRPPIAPSVAVAPIGAAVATGAAVVAAGAVAARHLPDSRVVLTPRDAKSAYAYWETPEAAKTALREQGGKQLQLRVLDVTDINVDEQPPHSTQEFECSETEPDLHVPIPQSDRDYIAEIGYKTDDNRWLKLAQSDSVRVPAPLDNGLNAGLKTAGLAAGATVLAAGAARAMADPLLDRATVVDDSRIILTPRSSESAYAYWETPSTSKAALQEQGGVAFQLRVHDVTDIDLDQQPAHSTQVYSLDELDSDRHVPISQSDRDYIAEIGYKTADGGWLKLARSSPVRISLEQGEAAMAAAAGAALAGATVLQPLENPTVLQPVSLPTVIQPTAVEVSTDSPSPVRCSITHLKVHSQRNCFLLDAEQMNQIQTQTAVTQGLEPGQYIIRIKEGGFGYRSAEFFSEPIVMLWIYGGTVINQKTNVPVGATWSTLNGYDETLSLEVQEAATLCGFFFDTHLEDNQGEVTVSVVKL